MLSAQKAEAGLLLVTGSSDINSSVVNDTIVQKNCRLHVRGHLLGNSTIEPGAKVIIEGSVTGKIISRGAGSIPEAKHVRAAAPNSTIYVLNGLYCGAEPAFAAINARPVINSSIELAAWDDFVRC